MMLSRYKDTVGISVLLTRMHMWNTVYIHVEEIL